MLSIRGHAKQRVRVQSMMGSKAYCMRPYWKDCVCCEYGGAKIDEGGFNAVVRMVDKVEDETTNTESCLDEPRSSNLFRCKSSRELIRLIE